MVLALALGECVEDAEFSGVAIETCCTGALVCWEEEVRRYYRATASEYAIAPHSSAAIKFGNSNRFPSTGSCARWENWDPWLSSRPKYSVLI
jgi:hypothetical protein